MLRSCEACISGSVEYVTVKGFRHCLAREDHMRVCTVNIMVVCTITFVYRDTDDPSLLCSLFPGLTWLIQPLPKVCVKPPSVPPFPFLSMVLFWLLMRLGPGVLSAADKHSYQATPSPWVSSHCPFSSADPEDTAGFASDMPFNLLSTILPFLESLQKRKYSGRLGSLKSSRVAAGRE